MAEIESKSNQNIKSTPDKKKTFKCELCANTFVYKHSLKHHTTSVHEGRKEYKCSTGGPRLVRLLGF